jgi:urease gamma subunit
VTVDDKIIHYIASLVANTRRHRAVQIGASPRAAIALLQTARVEASVQGRSFVVPDDVKTHGRAVLRHRLILQPDAEIEGVTADEVIDGVLHETQVPGMGQSGRPERERRGTFADVTPPAPSPRVASPRVSSNVPEGIEVLRPEAPAPSGPARPATYTGRGPTSGE